MAKRAVIWTETAAKQRREVLKYWTKRNGSPEYAKKLIKITKKRVNVIARYPESGVTTQHDNTRMSALGHFSIFYIANDDTIVIVAFWDNRQDPASLLKLIQEH